MFGPGALSTWISAVPSQWQTYVIAPADPTLSPLYGGGTSIVTNPTDNGGSTTSTYAWGTSIFGATAPPDAPIGCPPNDIPQGSRSAPSAPQDSLGALLVQQYTLFPNPSDGNITLRQLIPNSETLSAVILNATGQEIFNGDFHFEGGTTEFQMMNKVPGLYLLQLKDVKGARYNLKFTIK
jgi:hypothetical protein